MREVLTAMIKAHEIQGCIALENSFNKVGLDHVVLVKVASTAVVCGLLGLNREADASMRFRWRGWMGRVCGRIGMRRIRVRGKAGRRATRPAGRCGWR